MQFRLKTYDLQSDKIKNSKVRVHFICDLHGLSFGVKNEELIKVIDERKPDLILLGGDMIVGHRSDPAQWRIPRALIRRLKRRYPVYYALGNHEENVKERWARALKAPEIMLDNQKKTIEVAGEKITIYGLSLDLSYYKKPFPAKLKRGEIERLIGSAKGAKEYSILLAHNPYHADAYFEQGSDLILAGHYHGGVVRFGENHGLVSTHFHPFPKYCCGHFSKGKQDLIVSGGLGEHTMKLRIHNPRELIEINLSPAK